MILSKTNIAGYRNWSIISWLWFIAGNIGNIGTTFQILESELEFIDKLNNKEKNLDKQKDIFYEGILSGPGWKDDFK